MSYKPRSLYQRKVDLYCRILTKGAKMDRDYFESVGRFILAILMLGLVYNGQVGGTIGVAGATITSGIDLAAVIEAVIKVRTKNTSNRSSSD